MQDIAPAELQRHAVDRGGAEHEHPGEQKSRREQEQRRAIRNGELGDGERRRPEQAERRRPELATGIEATARRCG